MTSKQTESLVRLILAIRFADKNITLRESEAVDKELASLDWTSGFALSLFVQQSTSEVRKAMATPEGKQAFLQEQCAAFTEREAQRDVLRSLEAVMRADGIDATENSLLDEIKALFA